MASTGHRPWDPAEYLKTDADIEAYLDSAFEDGDLALIAGALGDIARARGKGAVALAAGLDPERLSGSASPDGVPTLETIMHVIHALGLSVHTSFAGPAATTRRARTKSSPRTAAPRVSPTLART